MRIGMGNFQDIKPKDMVEVYMEESKARKLQDRSNFRKSYEYPRQERVTELIHQEISR